MWKNKTGKEFRLADNLPYTFDFKDKNKVNLYVMIKMVIELIYQKEKKYQFNPSNTDPSKKSSFKFDFYLKNQSAKMSLNDLGNLNPNGNYDPNNSQGWEKITKIIEFGLYTPIAKENQYQLNDGDIPWYIVDRFSLNKGLEIIKNNTPIVN